MADSTLASASIAAVRSRGVSRDVATMAAVLAVACVLGLLEASLPTLPVLPWLKLGLANIAVVVALAMGSVKTAVVASLGRVAIVALATGSIGSIAFVIALAGASASVGTMWLLVRAGDRFSPIGWSAAGSAAHVAAQFVAASALIGTWSVMMLAPISILIALPLGMVTGSLARTVVSRLER